MEKYKIIWKDIIEFWKEEKSFVFFSVCSIMLYFVSFLFCYGSHSWDKGFLTILTNGKIGILQGTILAGYLFVWHYGLEERRTSWQSLMVLGMNKRNILMVLQGEIMVFQIFAFFFAVLFGIGYHIWIGHASFDRYLSDIGWSCLEMQIICGIGEMVFMKNGRRT